MHNHDYTMMPTNSCSYFAPKPFSQAIYSTFVEYTLSYAMFYLAHESTFSNKSNGSHKGVEALPYVYKTESMNITRGRGKGTATVAFSAPALAISCRLAL
jgi:hypothetical protein